MTSFQQTRPHSKCVSHNILAVMPIVAALTASCLIRSHYKYFWNDELYSYYLLSEPTFRNMITAFSDQINAAPPLYFILGWYWAQIFGSHELSLRLFSSVGMSVSVVVFFFVLTRAYDIWSSLVGASCVFLASFNLLVQNAEARMYGLFMATAAFVLLTFDNACRKKDISVIIFIAIFISNASLVNTHVFGIVYSGIALCVIMMNDYFKGWYRPLVYLSFAAAWMTLFIYLPIFLVHLDASSPRSWYFLKNFSDVSALFPLKGPLAGVLIFILIIAFRQIIINRQKKQFEFIKIAYLQCVDSKIHLLAIAIIYALVPFIIQTFSIIIKPIYVTRYVLPSLLGWGIMISQSLYILRSLPAVLSLDCSRPSTIDRLLSIVYFWLQRPLFYIMCTVALIIMPIDYAFTWKKPPIPGQYDKTYGYDNLPIVVQFSHRFLQRMHYAPDRERYFFILDWESNVIEASGLSSPLEQKTMAAIRRNFGDRLVKNIVDSDVFLSSYDRFLVLDHKGYDRACTAEPVVSNFHCPQWLEKRILSNPRYEVTELGDVPGGFLLLVESDKKSRMLRKPQVLP